MSSVCDIVTNKKPKDCFFCERGFKILQKKNIHCHSLAGVAGGDGQLLAALCAVHTDATHHIGNSLLRRNMDGQGPFIGLVVVGHTVVVVLLVEHIGYIIVAALPVENHQVV